MKLNKNLQDKAKFYVDEYKRCKNDFRYFCENYIILELAGADEYFKPYDEQLGLIKALEEHKNIICLKSRQIGISTVLQAYSCFLLVFFRNVSIGILSKDGPEATSFARIIAGFIDKLPGWMRPTFVKRNEQTFILSSGGKCFSATVNPKAPGRTLRGKAITFLISDETGHTSDIDKAWVGLVSALATSQKAARKNKIPFGTIMVSTPNGIFGQGAFYHRMYMDALNGDDIFKPYTIHWSQVKALADDPLWYETQKKMFKNEQDIKQELDLEFISSEGSFFPGDICSQLQTNTRDLEPLTKHKIFNGEIHTFALPTPNTNYIIGVDTAPEIGSDKSAIVVLNYETLDQVFEYLGKCQVQDFIKIVKTTMISYPGVVVIENNSYGNQVVEAINNSEFSHALYREKRSANLIVPGLSVNAKTRPLMIDALYTYVTQFPNTIKSKRLALELIGLEFKQPGGKVEAGSGGHDDAALAASMCYYVRKYDPPMFINHNSEEYSNMIDIFDLNDDTKYFNAHSDIENKNAKILKQVKDNYEDYEGYTDLFSITNG